MHTTDADALTGNLDSPQMANAAISESAVSAVNTTAPGQLRVIKRNGTVVPYTDDKISVAMTKAFLAVEGGTCLLYTSPSPRD